MATISCVADATDTSGLRPRSQLMTHECCQFVDNLIVVR
jgi:hypothetical protein